MAKKVQGYVKLQIKGGAANPSPPVGPALGQQGVNIMEFCKAFNAQTQNPEMKDKPLPVVITVYSDRSFTFEIKTPPATYLIKEAANVKKGSATPHTQKVGKVTVAQLREIAKIKMTDLNAVDIEGGVRMLAGSARSIGIDVEGEI